MDKKTKTYPFGEIEFFDQLEEHAWDQIHDGMLPIMDLYLDPTVTDIFINRYDNIYTSVGNAANLLI